MGLLNNLLFGGPYSYRNYINQEIEYGPPDFSEFLQGMDLSFDWLQLISKNGLGAAQRYSAEQIDPRIDLYTKIMKAPESNGVFNGIEEDNPIGINIGKQIDFFLELAKKPPWGQANTDEEIISRGTEGIVSLLIDGYAALLVEQRINKLPRRRGDKCMVKRGCHDFMITLTARCWKNDIGEDIREAFNLDSKAFGLSDSINLKENDDNLPPFGAEPIDPRWRFFRYLVVSGFYYGCLSS